MTKILESVVEYVFRDQQKSYFNTPIVPKPSLSIHHFRSQKELDTSMLLFELPV